MNTKCFPLRVLLTVTTDRLLTKPRGDHNNGIGDLYEILVWMTGDECYTHQLPRFGSECKPWLLRWFPRLAELTPHVVTFFESKRPYAEFDAFLEQMVGMIGQSEFDVPQIPRDDHTVIDPVAELIAMRGGTEGIVVL